MVLIPVRVVGLVGGARGLRRPPAAESACALAAASRCPAGGAAAAAPPRRPPRPLAGLVLALHLALELGRGDALTSLADAVGDRLMMTLQERIASSLPGITNSASSGSQFVSTSPITGILQRRASRIASASFFRSTTNIACGSRFMSATPPRFVSSFSSCAGWAGAPWSGAGSSCPSSRSRRSSCERVDALLDGAVVREQAADPAVVDVRLADALGVLLDPSWHCFFVPTKSTDPPRSATLRAKTWAFSDQLDGLLQVDDVDAAALPEDEAAHLGVPAARLVAEVNAGLEQLAHGDCGQSAILLFG